MEWEKNIFGMISPDEWLDVGRTVTRQNDPVDVLFGDERTNNLMARWQSIASEYQIPMMAQFHGFDTEAKTTFRVPVDTHNVEKGLIKVKINQSERLRALTRTGITATNQLIDYVLQDGIRLADQVVTRTKVAKNELLATGKVTIKENNLNLTVDYGVPSGNLSYTLDLSNANADIPAQIQTIIDAAAAKGVTITGIVTSSRNLTKMRQHKSVQTSINGTASVGALVRRSDLNDWLNDEFGISQIVTNDLTYGASATMSANGRPTVSTKRYFPTDKVTFFAGNPSGRLGIGLWGDPPEMDAAQFIQGNASDVSPFVYVSQWAEKDPAVLWTKASGLFMPVLYNPDSLFVATVA